MENLSTETENRVDTNNKKGVKWGSRETVELRKGKRRSHNKSQKSLLKIIEDDDNGKVRNK